LADGGSAAGAGVGVDGLELRKGDFLMGWVGAERSAGAGATLASTAFSTKSFCTAFSIISTCGCNDDGASRCSSGSWGRSGCWFGA
jgi:hypothetical protein